MRDDWRINGRQFCLLVFLYSVGTTILITINAMADAAGQDAWISAVLGIALSTLLLWLYTSMAKLYPDMVFTEAMEAALGKWPGKALSLSFVMFSYIGSTTALFVVGDFLKTLMMPETPMVAIHILFAAVVVLGVRLGVETMARAAELLLPLVLFFFVFLVIFSSPDFEAKNIRPVLEAGMGSILKGAFLFLGVFSLPQVVLLMVFPGCLNREGRVSRNFYIGMLSAGAVILVMVVYCTAVLGAGFTAENVFPAFTLAKTINIGDIIQRAEAVIAGMWIITIFYRTALYFCAAVLGLSKVLGLRDYRPLTLPMGMLMVALSLIVYPDISYAIMWDARVWPSYALVHGLFLPLVVLIVGFIRNRKRISKKVSR